MTDPNSDPSSMLWPEPPAPPSGRSREGLFLSATVLLAAFLVLGGLFLWSRQGDGGSGGDGSGDDAASAAPPVVTDEATGETAPDEAVPDVLADETGADETGADDTGADGTGSTNLADSIGCPEGERVEVCDAAAFVEAQRGRPFKEFPTVELIDDGAFAERLLRDFEDSRADLEIDTDVWRSLGFIDADVDLYQALVRSYEVGVVGVYFIDTEELYIQGTELDLYAQLVIVHELTHAHDDQWFDLERLEYEEADDEVGYGFAAVVEGSASRVEAAWRAQLSASDQAELDRLEATVLSPEEVEIYLSLPLMLLQLQISPYTDGEQFVEALAAAGGEAAIDAALLDPPRTSEQVLHPDRFIDLEEAVVVETPVAEGEIIDEGVVGELAFDLWLGNRAGNGWGGDRYVSWRTDEGACTRVDVVGDTAEDTEEYAVAAGSWATQGQGRTVERVGDLVRVTGCYQR
jgi:hypothetical protein